jgi:hypothetical protein
MFINILIVVAILLSAGFLFSKKIRDSEKWRATVTPLASIIGSGFLIIAPLLVFATGRYMLFAISLLVAIGYACGESIRFNILHLEPFLEKNKHGFFLTHLENISKIALALAYVISVTFYLQLLSAFLLRALGLSGQHWVDIITTVLIISISLIGKFRGLDMLEKLEEYTVSLKIAIISGLLIGLCYFNSDLLFSGNWLIEIPEKEISADALRILFGSLIVVQGFETSRFLGSKYKPEVRIQTMRTAQIIAGVIYFIFIGLIAVVFKEEPNVSETAIVDLTGRIASVLPGALIFAAIMSQLSAAIADTVGSGGLIFEGLRKKISIKNSYLVIGSFALALTWMKDVFQIVALASQAFAFYYSLQALASASLAHRLGYRWRTLLFGLLSLGLLLIVIFGKPMSV